MKCMFGVLAVASLCLARPEADPAILLTHPVAAHPAPLFAHPAPVLAHSVAPAPVLAHAVAPVAPVLPVAHAVAHAPLVKSVVEVPAEVSHEVVAHPVFHHVAPVVHHAPLLHHAPVAVAHHAVDPVALTHGAVHQVTPFVDLGRKKREADAEADAEADPFAYHYSSVSTPYAHYGSFVPDALPHHPVVATVHARAHHGFGYYGYPYGGYYHGFAGHYFG